MSLDLNINEALTIFFRCWHQAVETLPETEIIVVNHYVDQFFSLLYMCCAYGCFILYYPENGNYEINSLYIMNILDAGSEQKKKGFFFTFYYFSQPVNKNRQISKSSFLFNFEFLKKLFTIFSTFPFGDFFKNACEISFKLYVFIFI